MSTTTGRLSLVMIIVDEACAYRLTIDQVVMVILIFFGLFCSLAHYICIKSIWFIQTNSIFIYIDSKSLLIFTDHRVCFNSIDDDDDDDETSKKQKTYNLLFHQNILNKKKKNPNRYNK